MPLSFSAAVPIDYSDGSSMPSRLSAWSWAGSSRNCASRVAARYLNMDASRWVCVN